MSGNHATGASALEPREPRGADALAALLEGLGIDPPVMEHAPAFTVEESKALCGTIPGLHTKNLFLKDKKGALFLVVAPEDAALDLKTIHSAIGARGRVSFGAAPLMNDVLGVAPGSVTPLALINDHEGRVACVVDRRVSEASLVNVHPLRNTATMTLTREELASILDAVHHPPAVVDLPAPGPAG